MSILLGMLINERVVTKVPHPLEDGLEMHLSVVYGRPMASTAHGRFDHALLDRNGGDAFAQRSKAAVVRGTYG
jgi:hypothetical protein